jgi:tRNA modification GTPase
MYDAQIVLFVIDGSVGLCSQQIELFGSIATKNKIIVIGEGLDALKKTIVSEILESNVDISASDIVFTMRQKVVICKALEIIEQLSDLLTEGIGHELVAIDLRRAVDTVAEITGEVVTDDILDIVFSTFCVGK